MLLDTAKIIEGIEPMLTDIIKKSVREVLAEESKMPPIQDPEIWHGFEPICQYLGVSKSTIIRWKAEGKLPPSCYQKRSKKNIIFFVSEVKKHFPK